ncbi:exosome component 10-like [Actinia tenebrosa]|uniref:Exosome complex component 10 n=1 Tax=Actinia tenebrosa TaxID=6105 RepID=A0A6P8H6I1_ACTTE|nr:exosome component 10-like [Actinia tenebrosa]
MNESVKQSKPVVSSWNRRSHGGVKDSPVRLLLAKNILRPQIKFKDKIDNSNSPFVPIIKYKPNAIKKLQIYTPSSPQPEDLSIPTAIADFVHQQRMISNTTTNRICHPYQHELEVFEPPENQLKEAKEELYKGLEETPYTYVETVEQLEELCQKLSSVTEFAVDLEHHSYRSFQGFVCLMQISTRDHDYLVDTLELRSDLSILNESFTNPKILKVLHGADMDIGWLQRDFGLYIVNMFDTGQASRVLNYERFSLSYLLKKFCGVTANKQYQLADWRIRPLPAEMIQYAIEDTHYLLYIYDRLRNELIKSGNAQNNLLMSVYQRSKAVCLKKYEKPLFTKESYLNLYKKQRRPLNPQQLQVFQALYEWRDTIARQEDESYGYVLPNHMLFNLTESLPREPTGVLACCNPVPTLLKQYANEVHQIIQDAKERSVTVTEENISSTEATPMETSSRSPVVARLDVKETRSKSIERASQYASQVSTTPRPVKAYIPTGPQVKTMKPSISIFDYPQKAGPHNEGLEKAKEIMAGFVNPFKVVLPDLEAADVGNKNRTEQSKASIDKINENWKKVSSGVLEETSSSTQGTKIVNNDSDHEDSTPLRQKIEGKKKRKRKKKNETQEGDIPSTPIEKKIKSEDVDEEDDDDRNPSYEAITKVGKEFVPFDYNPTEYSKLEGNQEQSKEDVFNPYDQSKRQKKVNGPRSKVHMKAGQRSMTYSKNREIQKKQQWPRR